MILNQPSVADETELTVRRTIDIHVPLEKVWAAITEPEHLARWFGQRATLDDLAVGARGTMSFDGYGDFPLRVEELDPPRTIAYRWTSESTRAEDYAQEDFAQSTVFRFTLEPVADGTRLTVDESGFESLVNPTASLEGNRLGWDSELDELVAYLQAE
ncbi:uncharacterized protein YndB with AHSA1/START domain [Diaminobutyricimonas aerilata]|uniref:Uncharacterized protein YndB with AHSA1/START domain n=1 Tax=Diaminobutyricimonas aerilata TaxID=1162967 RepID=A0A2M9CNS9_9MICO|nr:SRPBCC family protein [Diaminobutyricimonas aerilata]PJJ73575.1 uncharacterized protein YndB with AHSA1/START domain [Diaminobutyricimonas aerilata]